VARRIYAPERGQLERVTSERPLRCVVAEPEPIVREHVVGFERWRASMCENFDLRSDQVHAIRHGSTVETIRVLEFVPRAPPNLDVARERSPVRR
jgi:hypothetical protein